MAGIVIDIDGVVADTEPWLVKCIEESSGKRLIFDNPRRYEFSIDVPYDVVIGYTEDAIIDYKHVTNPCNYPSTYIALIMLVQYHGVVNFLTARSKKTEPATRWWLDYHFPNISYELHSIGETSKSAWMMENGFDSIVDDRFKTANECRFESGHTFLVNQPWNEGRKEDRHVVRVDNLCEAIRKYIKTKKKSLTATKSCVIV